MAEFPSVCYQSCLRTENKGCWWRFVLQTIYSFGGKARSSIIIFGIPIDVNDDEVRDDLKEEPRG